MQYRNAYHPPEVRDDNDTQVITGYAAVFYRDGDPGTEFELWPGTRERIGRTAFDRALSEKHDVRSQFNHAGALLGRTTAGTLKLEVDNVGLRYTATPPDTHHASDLMKSIARGDIDGSSFAFRVTGEEWRNDGDTEVRTITDVELYEVGPVIFPAYKSASSGIRQEDLAECRAAHDNWKQSQDTRRTLTDVKNRALLDSIPR
jgi:HK97 family phage prohead protease